MVDNSFRGAYRVFRAFAKRGPMTIDEAYAHFGLRVFGLCLGPDNSLQHLIRAHEVEGDLTYDPQTRKYALTEKGKELTSRLKKAIDEDLKELRLY